MNFFKNDGLPYKFCYETTKNFGWRRDPTSVERGVDSRLEKDHMSAETIDSNQCTQPNLLDIMILSHENWDAIFSSM
jgi:hypothetical protein